ncbi:MAG: CRISPR-associated endonuclease Cas2 [Lentisphaerae bacterium]|nr:CRISPR-associated endonuclease Cas2 [Lentisphaerota bacterium]
MISEIKSVWLMVMFDLPVVTKEEKREYTHFRKYLLREGFLQLQFSVYAKFFSSRENAQKYFNYIKTAVPPGGRVRLLMVTDKQFGDMVSLYGKNIEEVEKKPEQLLLF